MPYTPLAQPLISGHASPDTQACVIIPARDEEQFLPRTLDALRLQTNIHGRSLPLNSYEVILLLNNCIDASHTVAERYRQTHPTFQFHIATRTLPQDHAHVGTARRMLMDTAHHRLQQSDRLQTAILSTDADTIVAPDWIARNLAAIEAGADVVGGVINLFPEDHSTLLNNDPGTYLAYQCDRQYQALVAQLESILDPDPSDPWPRHLEHFGASLACTPEIYDLAGGLPPVKPLEDVAFIDALRSVGARIRHCPDTHIFTSARLDGRAPVGLSGQLKIWQLQDQSSAPHIVDSAKWLHHKYRTRCALRRINESDVLPTLVSYPIRWQKQIASLHAQGLPNFRFLELLNADALIEELFACTNAPRFALISEVIATLTSTLAEHVAQLQPQSI